MDDIEEIKLDKDQYQRASLKNVGIKRIRRNNIKFDDIKDKPTSNMHQSNQFLPGRHSIFIKTWGCSHNNSDSEYMAGLLASQGYQLIMSDSQKNEADLWLLNSCTVKNPSEQTFVNAINSAKNEGKKIVVAGCVPQAQSGNLNWKDLSQIGVQQIDRVVEVVEETLKGASVKITSSKYDISESGKKKRSGGSNLDLPKIRKNPYVEIIPINTGCLNQCTYCKTKHARGDLGSYPPERICERMKSVINEGVTEIWLTSEDTGAYGRDLGLKISDLLKEIEKVLDEFLENGLNVMLRIGMTNPPYILDELDAICNFMKHPLVFKFLHIPVQSGSNKVLDDMRREYTVDQFRYIVDYLRDNVPGITVATDIICGFPNETEQDHKDTMNLLEELKFPVLHISQFYPRPGTPAARMQRVSTSVVKGRSREVTKLFNSYESNGDSIGKKFKVWISDEISSGGAKTVTNDDRVDDGWIAHDKFYRQIIIPKSCSTGRFKSLLGTTAMVSITKTGKFFMIGLIEDASTIQKANNKAVENEVILHRKGRNNRSVEFISSKTGETVKVSAAPRIKNFKTRLLILCVVSMIALLLAFNSFSLMGIVLDRISIKALLLATFTASSVEIIKMIK